MEWDESSAQRIAQQYKQEIREQIKEADDIAKVIHEQIAQEEEAEMNKVLAEDD